MKLQPRYKTIFQELKNQNRMTSAKIENRDYYNSARKIKDNFKSDLKEQGIIFGVPIEEYPYKIS